MKYNMKILRVIATMNPKHGGPSQGIRNSITEMAKHGVENEVVCFDDPESEYLKDESYTVHALGKSKGIWQSNPNLIPWLLENFCRFDVVIIHGLWLYNSYATYKAYSQYRARANKSEVPGIFVMPHGMLDPYFQNDPSRKFKALRNRLYWKFVESKIVNAVDGVLFTCQRELDLAKKSFKPYHPKNELNVSYGVVQPPPFSQHLLNEFFDQASSLRDKPYLLFLSRVQEKKGVDLLIDSYCKLQVQGVTLPKLVIAGPGLDTAYGRRLVAQVINNRDILFVGMLQGDAKWGAFHGCEAFILPSHQENFGISVVEAMACSKAVLITNQVNICTEIESEDAGLVEDDTEDGTAMLLRKWFSMTKYEKDKMGASAKRTYEKYFMVEKAALKMIEEIGLNTDKSNA